jgi:hypothetical protein
MSILLHIVVFPLPFCSVLGMETYEGLHKHNPLAFLQFTLELGFGFKSQPKAEQ